MKIQVKPAVFRPLNEKLLTPMVFKIIEAVAIKSSWLTSAVSQVVPATGVAGGLFKKPL